MQLFNDGMALPGFHGIQSYPLQWAGRVAAVQMKREGRETRGLQALRGAAWHCQPALEDDSDPNVKTQGEGEGLVCGGELDTYIIMLQSINRAEG